MDLTLADVEDLLKVSRATATSYITSGDLKATKGDGIAAGRTTPFRIDVADFADFIDRHTIARTGMRPNPTPDIPLMYKLRDVAGRFPRGLAWLQKAANAGQFEHIRIGRDVFLTDDQINKLLAQLVRQVRPAPDPLGGVRERLERERTRPKVTQRAA